MYSSSDGKGFEEFMCFGEGIHADCVDRDRVMNSKQKIVWPAGDDLEEDEVEEVNQCGNFRIFAKFRETNFSLSFFYSLKTRLGNYLPN